MNRQLMANSSEWFKPIPNLDGLSLIQHLFNRFDGLYPNVFKASVKGADGYNNWKNAWAEGFIEEKVTPQEVAKGLVVSRREYDYPPSFAKFLKACRSYDYEALFIESVRGHGARACGENFEFKNPVAFWAGHRFGSFDIRHSLYKDVTERWKNCVDTVIREGFDTVPELALQIAKKYEKADKEGVKKVFDAVTGVLDKKPTGIKHWLNVAATEGLPFKSYQMAYEGLAGLGCTPPEILNKRLGIEVTA